MPKNDTTDAVNSRPLPIIPPAQVTELSEFDLAFDAGQVEWIDDIPVCK